MAAQIWPSEEPTCHQLRSNDKLRGMGGCASELQRSRSLRRMATGGGSSTLATPDDLEGGELHLGRFATLTAIYALVEGALSHPYELIKTRQQAGAPSSLGRRMGTMPYMLHLVRTGGVRELYRGFGWSVIGGIPSEVIYYVGYTECKRMLLSTSAGAFQAGQQQRQNTRRLARPRCRLARTPPGRPPRTHAGRLARTPRTHASR